MCTLVVVWGSLYHLIHVSPSNQFFRFFPQGSTLTRVVEENSPISCPYHTPFNINKLKSK